MRILNPEFDLNKFLNQVSHSKQRALLLDYDGTLAPFQFQRDKAFPYPEVRKILSDILKSHQCRVVVISGRYTKDLKPLLGLENLPEIWGSHGMERLKPDGSYETVELNMPTLQALKEAAMQIDRLGLKAHSELKPGAIALHWRGFSDETVQMMRERIQPRWIQIAKESNLLLSQFDGGLELRACGRDKGDAVQTILAEMSQGSIAAYLGDDLTDEDAFLAIKGYGAAILVRPELRTTAADLWLKPPDELVDFLLKWYKTCGGTQ